MNMIDANLDFLQITLEFWLDDFAVVDDWMIHLVI